MSITANLFRRGWAVPLNEFGRFSRTYLRVAFLGSGLRSGLLHRLGEGPATADELMAALGGTPELIEGLRSWLDLGVEVGELKRRGEAYALGSRRARALVRESNDPVAAIYEEFAELDHRLVVETPGRLVSGQRFALTDADAEVIARASRIGEPWIEAALAGVVPREGRCRLVEVGCGSGAHIRTAALLNPRLEALGLELQEPAARQARSNLAAWGLAGRVRVETGDVRDRGGEGDADLVTLHQNLYYFPEAEQVALLRHLATFLAPGGTLLVTSAVRDAGIGTVGLDLWGAMTEGASRLPVPEVVVARLREAGLNEVTDRALGPGGMYHAFTGVRPR